MPERSPEALSARRTSRALVSRDAQGPLERLRDHEPAGPEEARDLERIVSFVERKEDPFDRTDPEGHLTGSGLVASRELDRVVLMHHRKLDMWLQCGGHAEDDESDARRVALREAREETGLRPLEPHPHWPGLVDVDVHEIPATDAMPEHLHLDLRFVLAADPSQQPTAPDGEAHEVRWFRLEEARSLDLDEGLQRLLWKLRSIRVDAGLDARTRHHSPERSGALHDG